MTFIHHNADNESEETPPQKLKRYADNLLYELSKGFFTPDSRRYFVPSRDLREYRKIRALTSAGDYSDYWEVVIEEDDL